MNELDRKAQVWLYLGFGVRLNTMPANRDKSMMRNLGEFVGHIVKAVKTDPKIKRQVVRKETEEEDRGSMILRRTTIEEIEFRDMRK